MNPQELVAGELDDHLAAHRAQIDEGSLLSSLGRGPVQSDDEGGVTPGGRAVSMRSSRCVSAASASDLRLCEIDRMDALPMFPLGSALLPGNLLPLQIFEPRYLGMVRDIVGGDGRFGVVLIERGFEVGGGDERFSIGTVATIERLQPTADGSVRLLARGGDRFEVATWLPEDPYPRAEVRTLPALEWSSEQLTHLAETERTVRRALVVMSEYRADLWPSDVELSDDPVTRSWQLAGISPLGALDQLALLRSSSVGDLLEHTARLTTEALDLLPMQLPDDPV